MECLSLITYLGTKLANKMLSLRKISQHINLDTLKWVPLVPFDREWTDEQLYEYFKLTEEEIKHIENTIK
jgi:site-specific DNA-methyltransferase (adenine-specific)